MPCSHAQKSQIGNPQRNDALAPAEPNIYRSSYSTKICAPAERDVPAMLRKPAYISLRSSEEECLGVSRSINIRSLRDGNPLENLAKENKKLSVGFAHSLIPMRHVR